MFKTIPKVFLWLILVFFLSGCKKENSLADQDTFIEQVEELSPLNATVSSAGATFIELQWLQVTNSHFNAVTYSIFLNGDKIIEGITGSKFSLINLKPGQQYAIKIVASTASGKQLSQSLTSNTLRAIIGNQGIFQEYQIHNYSSITGGTALKQLDDGGHLIARLLQHPGQFDIENFKIVIFRTDASGKMLWYRLVSLLAYNFSVYGELVIEVNKNGRDGLLFLNQHAIRLSMDNGEILQQRSYAADTTTLTFNSSFNVSDQKIILGTYQGSLMAINPNDLNLIWHKSNADRKGMVGQIKIDSKKNIYYVFRDAKDSNAKVRVMKCNENGDSMKEFLFDGTLPGESNWGFNMTALLVDEQDNLYLFGHNYDFNFMRWFKFTAEGTLIKKNQTSDNLLIYRALFNIKGEIVVSGQIQGASIERYGGIYVFDKEMNIKSKQVHRELPYHTLNGLTINPDGSYNLFLSFSTGNTSGYRSFVFTKTDTDGKL